MHDENTYYSRLAEGARYLAERAASIAERNRHLAAAARYRMQSIGEPYPPLRGRIAA